ncbi:MAG: hypothetical protein AAB602_02595 [Patescibacteria group bacterium]
MNKTKFALTAIIVGISALFIGKAIWPPAAELPEPTATQFLFFAFLALVEALFFGLGVAFVIFGMPYLKAASPKNQKKMLPSFISIAWLLLSWWPHDNLHFHIGEDLQGILYIDYGFHLTVIIASLILARHFFLLLKMAGK